MLDTKAIPNEIFVQIFSLRVDVTPYLASLSLVSHRFHALVEPILYKEIVVNQSTPTGIPRFLRTILSRPILACYVSLLDLCWACVPRGDLAGVTSPQDPADHQLFTAAATRVELFHPVDFQAEQVALLLYFLPNLLVLKVDPAGEFYPWQEPDVFEQILGEYASIPAADLPAGLRSVRSITFGPDGSEVSPIALFTMITLPCIREIDIHNLVDTDGAEASRLFSATNATSSVTSLRFGYGTINPLLLAHILVMPRALTRFSYTDYDGGPDSFNITSLWTGLQRCRDTLQVLELWFRLAAIIGDEGEKQGTVGSLRDWPALRSLRCQMATMLGKGLEKAVARLVDVVPVVMRHLTVDDDEYWKYPEVIEQVVEMVEERRCGRLVNVAVGGNWQGLEESVEVKLGAVCGAAGVVFAGYNWREY